MGARGFTSSEKRPGPVPCWSPTTQAAFRPFQCLIICLHRFLTLQWSCSYNFLSRYILKCSYIRITCVAQAIAVFLHRMDWRRMHRERESENAMIGDRPFARQHKTRLDCLLRIKLHSKLRCQVLSKYTGQTIWQSASNARRRRMNE